MATITPPKNMPEVKGISMKGEVIFKEVKLHGNGAHIYCPKRWAGFLVRCEVKRRVRK